MSEDFLKAIKKAKTCRDYHTESLTDKRSHDDKPKEKQELNIKPILEAISSAPSEYGLKPYSIHVINRKKNPEMIARMAEGCWKNISKCSDLLVFVVKTDSRFAVDQFIEMRALDKYNPDYAELIRSRFYSMSHAEYDQWASNQAYIALGYALAAVATMNDRDEVTSNVACCPMTHFEPSKAYSLMESLPEGSPPNQNQSKYRPMLLLPIGYSGQANKAEKSCSSSPEKGAADPLPSPVDLIVHY